MNNIAKYIGCNEEDEFEYYFEINGQKVIVFNMFGEPNILVPGVYCSIKINLFCVDECQIEPINEIKYGVEKADSSYYAYYLYGKLEDSKLDLNGFIVEDEVFTNYKQFEHNFVKVKVDRIDIRILEKQ